MNKFYYYRKVHTHSEVEGSLGTAWAVYKLGDSNPVAIYNINRTEEEMRVIVDGLNNRN